MLGEDSGDSLFTDNGQGFQSWFDPTVRPSHCSEKQDDAQRVNLQGM